MDFEVDIMTGLPNITLQFIITSIISSLGQINLLRIKITSEDEDVGRRSTVYY